MRRQNVRARTRTSRLQSARDRADSNSRLNRILLACSTALLCMLSYGAGPADAQVLNKNFAVTDGTVEAVAASGAVVYIGGKFTRGGPATGQAVLINTTSGAVVAGYPKVAGAAVYAVAPDGSGGYFIGGNFSFVGGFPRANLAHILSDKTVSS